jgi:hypothetical protein
VAAALGAVTGRAQATSVAGAGAPASQPPVLPPNTGEAGLK